MARILVVGVGDIGGRLAMQLSQQGHEVWGMRRSDKPLSDDVSLLVGDVANLDEYPSLPDQLDIVVYCVASPVFSREGYHAYYVKGLQNTLTRLNGQTPKRVFFVSSSSVYHQMEGEWVDETSSTKPASFSGQEMLAAENYLEQHDFPSTSVRFTGIYGPGRNRMIEQAKGGGYCDPEPPVWTNRIHRDDCIGVLQLLIERSLKKLPIENCYLATDDEPATLFDVLEWMKDRIGEVEPDHDVGEITRRANRRCRNQRLRSLGYRFRYTNFREGYDSMLIDMGLV